MNERSNSQTYVWKTLIFMVNHTIDIRTSKFTVKELQTHDDGCTTFDQTHIIFKKRGLYP